MGVYLKALGKLGSGEIDWEDDTIKCMLLDDEHSFAFNTDEFIDDVSGDEVSGSGYTAGGITVSGKTKSEDAGNNRFLFDCTDPSIDPSTVTAGKYVFYKDTGDPGTSPLICGNSFTNGEQSSSGAGFTVNIPTAGVFEIAKQ